jgi:hypothetical protein
MTRHELDVADKFWGRPQRTATAVVFIGLILGLAAYIIFVADSFSGGYGPHVVFPPIHDRDSLRIMLTRTPCLGPCPSYSVEIRGDGTVIYEGESCVGDRGHRDSHMFESEIDALFEPFKRADFLSLRDSYWEFATDLPTFKISLRYDGVNKTVTDYGGRDAGMPPAVTDLENAIDEAARTEQWISGSGCWTTARGQ